MRPLRAPATAARKASGVATLAALALAVTSPVALTGCGDPEFCSDRSDLEQSIGDLGNVNLLESGGLDRLKTQLGKIETDAKELADSAKGDFPSESSAVQSSVTTLKTTVEGLPSSPTPQQLSKVATDTTAVVTAVQKFADATDSDCS